MQDLIEIKQDDKGLASAADIASANQALAAAESAVVTDQESAEEAGALLKKFSAAEKALADRRMEITRPIDAAKKSVMDLFRSPQDTLGKARSVIKRKMAAWHDEQERIAREERRKAEEKAERERKKAEEKAAKYAEDGRDDLAGKWEERAEEAAVAPVEPVSAPKPVKGVSMRTNYSGEVTDMSAFLKAVAENKVPESCVDVKFGVLNKYITQFKGKVDIPGVRVVVKKTAAG